MAFALIVLGLGSWGRGRGAVPAGRHLAPCRLGSVGGGRRRNLEQAVKSGPCESRWVAEKVVNRVRHGGANGIVPDTVGWGLAAIWDVGSSKRSIVRTHAMDSLRGRSGHPRSAKCADPRLVDRAPVEKHRHWASSWLANWAHAILPLAARWSRSHSPRKTCRKIPSKTLMVGASHLSATASRTLAPTELPGSG
jgi:hypothetical protein